MVSVPAINQQLEKLEARGVIPKEVIRHDPLPLAANTSAICADVVDAVRWHDQKDEELRNLKTQDATNQHAAWLDVLIEDFIAFDPTPSDSADNSIVILKNLDHEVEDLMKGAHGPDARNYMQKLRRELSLVLEKLESPNG